MTCQFVPLPRGGHAIICGPTRRCAGCGKPARLECDWKVPGRKSGTCDKPICAACTMSPAPDKDLCPAHAAEWRARLARATPAAPPPSDPIPSDDDAGSTAHFGSAAGGRISPSSTMTGNVSPAHRPKVRRHGECHGPTPREQQMIALQEAGLDAAQIADSMGIGRTTVVNRLSHLSMNDCASDRAFFSNVIQGSQLLAARLLSIGGHPS